MEFMSELTDSAPVESSTVSVEEWLTISQLAEILGTSPARIRRMIQEDYLAGIKRDGTLVVPAKFLKDGEPLAHLRGTITLLKDNGFTEEEIVSWLTEPNDLMELTPVDALRAGHRAEVRRVAQSLAY